MSVLDRVFSHQVLAEAPPVLVDVGASGGMHPAWRSIARYSIGVGFEPDARERAALNPAQKAFRRWIFSDRIVVAEPGRTETDLYLTASPFCSSTLRPNEAALADWSFADLFSIQGTRRFPSTTLVAVLKDSGLACVDWLKCDTQGTDLRIWQSLPAEMRRRSLAVEFEPGLIDAYQGEDKLHQVLAAMEEEPFWLARLEVLGTPRGRMETMQRRIGARLAAFYRGHGQVAAGWVNAVYLHDGTDLSLRESLLLWVFTTGMGHHLFACEVAEAAARRHDDALCAELADHSSKRMRRALWATWPQWPAIAWRKFFGH